MRGKLLLASAWILLAGVSHAQMTRQELAGQMETQVRQLAAAGIEYGESWVPPGQGAAWAMDCSNTARWLYASTLNKPLPRTASAQYEALKSAGRLWSKGGLRNLKPGDLLFWENTYKPTRKPPITHVMVFLGKDSIGRMWMMGSQGSRGVDVYRFNPTQDMGGYNWFLWFKKKGRFVAFGRPA